MLIPFGADSNFNSALKEYLRFDIVLYLLQQIYAG